MFIQVQVSLLFFPGLLFEIRSCPVILGGAFTLPCTFFLTVMPKKLEFIYIEGRPMCEQIQRVLYMKCWH